MRVLLIGATGVLGRGALPALHAAGHTVTGLARNTERAAAVRAVGVEPVVADIVDRDSLRTALRGQEAVLNLSTRIPAGVRAMRRGAWADNDRLRREGSAALVDAALTEDSVRVIVQEGITFGYADGGDRELTEDAPMAPFGPLRSSIDAHRAVARFADAGRTGVRLRIAALQSGTDAMSLLLLRAARWRVPVLPGSADSWFTVVHPSDAGAAAVAALSAPSGVYNVGATPLRRGDYRRVLAEAAGVRTVPLLPARLAFGPAKVFARSQRVVSDKLTDATGWRPARPTVSAAWFDA